MKKADKDALVQRIAAKLYKKGYSSVLSTLLAMDVYRVVSRLAHAAIPGHQRKTKKSRDEADAKVREMVTITVKVL